MLSSKILHCFVFDRGVGIFHDCIMFGTVVPAVLAGTTVPNMMAHNNRRKNSCMRASVGGAVLLVLGINYFKLSVKLMGWFLLRGE